MFLDVLFKIRIGLLSLAVLLLVYTSVAPPACAQKGMGEETGVARQAVKPEVVSLSGTVQAVEIGPCQNTTGRATVGVHFYLKTAEGETCNVHLGPAGAVEHVADRLRIGDNVTVKAFRTAKMPENHYVAQSLSLDGTSIQLRDESLRPFWAGGSGVVGGRRGPQRNTAQWQGYGLGRGWGNCPAWGGPPQRRGAGWGGPPQGFGRGGPPRGYGRGPGYGR